MIMRNAGGVDDKERLDASLLNVVLIVPALSHFAHGGSNLQKEKGNLQKI